MQHCVVGKKQVTTFFLFFSVWLHWRTNLYVGSEAADPMVISVCASINVAVQWLPILSCRLFIAYFIIHNITATLTIRWRQSIFNQPRCICVYECVCVSCNEEHLSPYLFIERPRNCDNSQNDWNWISLLLTDFWCLFHNGVVYSYTIAIIHWMPMYDGLRNPSNGARDDDDDDDYENDDNKKPLITRLGI